MGSKVSKEAEKSAEIDIGLCIFGPAAFKSLRIDSKKDTGTKLSRKDIDPCADTNMSAPSQNHVCTPFWLAWIDDDNSAGKHWCWLFWLLSVAN